MSKLCVVVPTYNEASNLQKLAERIEEVLGDRGFRIVIVDDNSPDGTARIAEQLNDLYGNIVVKSRARKYGLGSAMRVGLKTALAMQDVEGIITLDADLSHSPSDIPKLLNVTPADVVQGSRYITNGCVVGWGLKRRTTSRMANLICKLFLRMSVHDCTGNFRVYSRNGAENVVRLAGSMGFEWTTEAMLIAERLNLRIKEVPITFVDRKKGETKLTAFEVVNWMFFAFKSLFSIRSALTRRAGQRTHAIQRSSTLSVTVTAPAASTTR